MTDDEAERLQRIVAQEAVMREQHADYTETIARAGVFQATNVLPDGGWGDPTLAAVIYTHPNPPARAYEIAKLILAGQHAPPQIRGREPIEDIVRRLLTAIDVGLSAGTIQVTPAPPPSWRTRVLTWLHRVIGAGESRG